METFVLSSRSLEKKSSSGVVFWDESGNFWQKEDTESYISALHNRLQNHTNQTLPFLILTYEWNHEQCVLVVQENQPHWFRYKYSAIYERHRLTETSLPSLLTFSKSPSDSIWTSCTFSSSARSNCVCSLQKWIIMARSNPTSIDYKTRSRRTNWAVWHHHGKIKLNFVFWKVHENILLFPHRSREAFVLRVSVCRHCGEAEICSCWLSGPGRVQKDDDRVSRQRRDVVLAGDLYGFVQGLTVTLQQLWTAARRSENERERER